MKKLFLLMAAAVAVSSASAQKSNVGSVVYVGNRVQSVNHDKHASDVPFVNKHANQANKGTAATEGWFSYLNLMYVSGTSKGWYTEMYQDSSLQGTATDGPYHVGTFGMGTSFDPMDSVYFGGDANLTTSAGAIQNTEAIPEFRMLRKDSYVIDSIDFSGKYMRRQNYTDTLIVDIVKQTPPSAPTFGVYSLGFTTATLYDITPDGKPRFVTAIYDPIHNGFSDSIPTANRVRITKLLDQAFWEDSLATGGSKTTFKLPTAMTVDSAQRVVAMVSFRSGFAYPLHTDINTANVFRMYSYELGGDKAWPKQNVNSYQTGLVTTRQSKYPKDAEDAFLFEGHTIAIPSVAYGADAGNDCPDFSFYVKCATCLPLGINKTESQNIANVGAYPNPATDNVAVRFDLKSAANANVSILNAMGQVIATQTLGNVTNGKAFFSVANLSNGVYFYTVEAGGQRTTNRFVVAH